MIGRIAVLGVLAGSLALGGCGTNDRTDEQTDGRAVDGTAVQPGTQPPPQPGQPGQMGQQGDMRIEVDISSRQLHVYRGGQIAESHPVAVGSAEWPTPTGEWTIGQVVFNPEWIPPDEEWAKDEKRTPPGDPENPLGRAQLVYSPPNTVHGTNEPNSLGMAVSHGSIRVANDVAVRLARQVMEAGGATRDDAFFRQVEQNRTQRESVSIPNPVPIRVR
jgi:lipoprotein-anchoring transpeptidase ErfK/SrfK